MGITWSVMNEILCWFRMVHHGNDVSECYEIGYVIWYKYYMEKTNKYICIYFS